MPELPEAETIVRGLRPALHGTVISRTRVLRPDILRTSPARFRKHVTGLGDSMAGAGERSRAAAARIQFDGKRSRSDIGWRELARSSPAPGAGHVPSA